MPTEIEKLREFIEFVKTAPVSSGVCCCGDDMERHADPMSCGHAPVDQWDYSLSLWLESLSQPEAAGSGVRVKALEWWVADSGDMISDSIVGRYRLGRVTANTNFRLETPSGVIDKSAPGHYWPENEAKAAAQADYERRILSALSPSPEQGEPKPVADAVGGEAKRTSAIDYWLKMRAPVEVAEYVNHLEERLAPPSDEAARLREEVARLTKALAEAEQDAEMWQERAMEASRQPSDGAIYAAVSHRAEARLTQAERVPVVTDKAEGAIAGLKRLKADFNMRGANATTLERAIQFIREAALQPQEQGR